MIGTFSGKGQQSLFRHQIDLPSEQLLQVAPHPEELQSYGLAPVENHHDVHIAVGSFLASGVGAEQPCFQDGLRLEIFGDGLCHGLCGHSLFYYFADKDTKKIETAKAISIFLFGVTGVAFPFGQRPLVQELQTNAVLISLSPSDGRGWGGLCRRHLIRVVSYGVVKMP